MKKKIRDLQPGELIQLFESGEPLSYPHQVALIEFFPDTKRVSALHLVDPSGNKKLYSFLDTDQLVTMYDWYEEDKSFCPHCGSVTK